MQTAKKFGLMYSQKMHLIEGFCKRQTVLCTQYVDWVYTEATLAEVREHRF
jgi:hypothetical protein